MAQQPILRRANASSVRKTLVKDASSKSVRLQLTLKPQFAKRLHEMKNISHLGSYSEVMREALRVYESILRNAGHEGRLFIEKTNGSLVEIVI